MSHTIGSQLQQARLKRGLSLLDIAHKTRIPAPRLQDLEADNYNSHGGLTYAKSFLRTYANYLGVDASSILDLLQPPPLAGVKDYRYLIANLGPWIRARQFRAPRPQRPGSAQRGSFVTMSLVTAAVILLGTSLMFAKAMFNSGNTPKPEEVKAKPITALRALPALPAGETSQVSWTAPAGPPAPTSSIATTANIPVAIPVDSKTGELMKPSQRFPAPLKAIPVED